MKITEIINEAEDLTATGSVDPTVLANRKFNKEHPIKTAKLPWWRTATTNPKALQFRKDVNKQAAFDKEWHSPERIAQLSRPEPVIAANSAINPRTGELIDLSREFNDEYTVAQKKADAQEKSRLDYLSKVPKMPEVTPNSEMMPDVKIKRPQV
jgi:hypothetical protein